MNDNGVSFSIWLAVWTVAGAVVGGIALALIFGLT